MNGIGRTRHGGPSSGGNPRLSSRRRSERSQASGADITRSLALNSLIVAKPRRASASNGSGPSQAAVCSRTGNALSKSCGLLLGNF